MLRWLVGPPRRPVRRAKRKAGVFTPAFRVFALARRITSVDQSQACVFCERIASGQIKAENELAVAIADAFPVTAGHTLVVPRRHVTEFFDLSDDEQEAVWRLVAVVRARLLETGKPDGFNVGLNAGAAAGQTVPHAHVHVIPRYAGDSKDPRGGVRRVIPGKARYWKE